MKDTKPANITMYRMGHTLIAFLLPFLFLSSIISVFADFFSISPAGCAIFLAAVAFGGIAALLLHAIFKSERVSVRIRTQALVVTCILYYVAATLILDGTEPVSFLPSITKTALIAALMLQWLWSRMISTFFLSRESLLNDMEGLQGEGLYRAMREEGSYISETIEDLDKVALAARIGAGCLCLLILYGLTNGTHPGPLSFSLVVLFFTVYSITEFLLRLYKEEHYYASLGHINSFTLIQRKPPAAFALIGISLALAILVSSRNAIIPKSFFLYLLSLFKGGEPSTRNTEIPEFGEREMDSLTPEILKYLSENQRTFIDLSWLEDAVKYLLIAGGAVFILWFLFATFLSKYFYSFIGGGKLKNLLLTLLGTIKSLFLTIFTAGKGNGGTIRPSANLSAREASLKKRMGKGKSKEKKKEIGKLAGTFFLLVEWGERYGVLLSSTQAPGEYTHTLSDRIQKEDSVPPQEKSALMRNISMAGSLFEKALYSDTMLTNGELGDYSKAVTESIKKELTIGDIET